MNATTQIRPQVSTRRIAPGVLRVVVQWSDGRVTAYAMAMQLWATAWSRAVRKGEGLGSVLQFVIAKANEGKMVARQVIQRPTPYAQQMADELSAHPGVAFGIIKAAQELNGAPGLSQRGEV